MITLALLILWPVAEIFVAIKVGEAIGVLWTLLLLIAGWPLGAWALRSQGRVAWQRLSVAVTEGRAPGNEVLNGTLVLLGGVLLMIPGFITDVLGILALAPPTRALLRGVMVRNIRSRVMVTAVRFGQRPSDVDSTARDLEQPQLPR